MRKKKLWIGVLLLLLISLEANAEQRAMTITPVLSFNGTTANCSINVIANKNTDEVDAIMQLYESDTCLKTWKESGKGSVKINETSKVSTGKTYKLSVDVTVNGVEQLSKTVTKTNK